MNKSVFLKSALALALAAPLLASAESNAVSAATGTLSATARLDFRVTIPRVLFLRVGTAGTTIDRLTFNAAAADLGSGTDSAAQTVDVQVLGNAGAITIAATSATTGLTGPATIPWSEILATSTQPLNINVPQVGAAGLLVPVTSGAVTNRSTTWNYAYSNTNVVAPGTYDGQITYTATAP